eukprot:131850-Chlamydomonas_euryale.AAC.2
MALACAPGNEVAHKPAPTTAPTGQKCQEFGPRTATLSCKPVSATCLSVDEQHPWPVDCAQLLALSKLFGFGHWPGRKRQGHRCRVDSSPLFLQVRTNKPVHRCGYQGRVQAGRALA